MGRSTKSEPRHQQLNLSLTLSELQRVRERAEAVGMRAVHFARALVLDDSRKLQSKPNAENGATRLLYLQLARLGNNLNQLVRYLHRHGGPLPRELEPLLRDIRRLITRGEPR